MAQLYARIFLQILDSSIAEDFMLRHVFEDLLKLAEDGIVDMTRPALARRLNIPLETLNPYLEKLSSPDQSSRDEENDGRRIELVEDHRDWGWRIINWEKYEGIRRRADLAIRQARWRAKGKAKQNTVTEPLPIVTPASEREEDAMGRGLSNVQDKSLTNADTKDASLSLPAKIQEVFDAWNAQADNATLPKCLLISTKRRLAIATRLKVQFFQDNWRDALKRVTSSDFCKGISDRGWKASFDWFIAPDSVVKIMEGKYDNTTGKNAQGHNPRLDGVSRNTAVNSYDQAMFEQKMARQKAEAKNRPPIGP